MSNGKTNRAEMAPEPQEARGGEIKPTKREKPPKKPGSVSRFFNQFGIGKYWEKLNDYFEYEERMEAAAAEKEAKKETAEAIMIAGEEAVGEVRARGEGIPAQIESAAARAGVGNAEAAPVIAEARAREEEVEAEALAAKADFDEEIPVFLAEPESVGLPTADEIVKKAEGLPPVEEFEKIAEEHEVIAEMEKAKVEPIALKRVKKIKKEKSQVEELEELSMQEFFGDFGFKIGDKIKIRLDSGEVDSGWTLINIGSDKKSALVGKMGKNGEPMAKMVDLEELKQLKQEEGFFEEGEEKSKKVVQRMKKSLSKKRAVYAAQKAAEQKMTPEDKKAFKEWMEKTGGGVESAEEPRLEKVIDLGKSKRKKKAAKKKAA